MKRARDFRKMTHEELVNAVYANTQEYYDADDITAHRAQSTNLHALNKLTLEVLAAALDLVPTK